MKRSTATGKNRKFVIIIFVCACRVLSAASNKNVIACLLYQFKKNTIVRSKLNSNSSPKKTRSSNLKSIPSVFFVLTSSTFQVSM